ncbi:enoyl-CoA hydratase/isomerase family protein [Ditylenchus destructor]|uniref:Enoyl-CoA hydratase/isomerase family protein n=1 Tax=Ditylenchus destructor TaxID=166010 RepID=A0AAD4N9C4_9BILA|nr:enoyl-CoA hydratase/isomerase family protein [Ditylenchus destructor]
MLSVTRQFPRISLRLFNRRLYSASAAATLEPMGTELTPSEASTSNNEPKWDISVGIAVYRSALIAPPMSDVEKKIFEHFLAEEHDRTLKADFEIKIEKEKEKLKIREELLKKGDEKRLVEFDDSFGEKLLEKQAQLEEFRKIAAKKYRFDDITSLESKDPRSLRRKSDKKLILLVKQSFAPSDSEKGITDYESGTWSVPELKSDGGTLRETAERHWSRIVPDGPGLKIFGNAPIAHYRRTYSKRLRQKLLERSNDSVGSVVFLYAAQLQYTHLDSIYFNPDYISDYQWCSIDEIDTHIHNAKYRNCLKGILFE